MAFEKIGSYFNRGTCSKVVEPTVKNEMAKKACEAAKLMAADKDAKIAKINLTDYGTSIVETVRKESGNWVADSLKAIFVQAGLHLDIEEFEKAKKCGLVSEQIGIPTVFERSNRMIIR
jgi:Pyruvate/2-oxoacid:ferredoxin oxidoreductase gamma subunit